jgi:hypothetical protein
MTEAEWLTSEDPWDLLRSQLNEFRANRRKTGRRKLRLFGCASCRAIGNSLSDPRVLVAIDRVERFADGEVDTLTTPDIEEGTHQAWLDRLKMPVPPGMVQTQMPEYRVASAAGSLLKNDVVRCAHAVLRTYVIVDDADRRKWSNPLQEMCHLIRDIFGNPFRPATLDPAWRTDTAVTLAKQMYESREFGAMPILADALQDAGSDSEDVLDHCRGPGPHVRGCWVVDLVLGKE